MGDQKIYPAGVLHFTDTGKFHIVVFRCAPRPSESLADDSVRFRSIGHSQVEYESQEAACAVIEENDSYSFINLMWTGVSTEGISMNIEHSPNVF